jgi:hypothetical protein
LGENNLKLLKNADIFINYFLINLVFAKRIKEEVQKVIITKRIRISMSISST